MVADLSVPSRVYSYTRLVTVSALERTRRTILGEVGRQGASRGPR